MGDQAALQEAIQRARQLAAKISQNAPVKRSASELDDHRDIGTVKVTLAYEKPANSDSNKQQQQQQSEHRDHHHRSNSRDHRDNNNYSSTKESLLYPQTNRGDRERDGGDRSREKDRDYDRESNYPSGGGNSNSVSSNNAYTRSGNNNNNNSQISTGYGSMLSGANSYSSNPADERIEIIIPHAVIGLVIGKGGENIKRIQNETGATVRVDPNTVDEKGNKVCTIVGTKQAVEEAHNQVSSVIENAATNKRPRMQTEGSEQYRMKIPASRTGAIIGKGGETIKSIKLQSGCDIELDKGSKDSGSDESIFIIRGTQDKILKARAMIESRLASRGRDGDNRDIGGRPNAGPKGVATGANAAPVAQFTDLPASYPGKSKFQQSIVDLISALIIEYICSTYLFTIKLQYHFYSSWTTNFRRCFRCLGRLLCTIL